MMRIKSSDEHRFSPRGESVRETNCKFFEAAPLYQKSSPWQVSFAVLCRVPAATIKHLPTCTHFKKWHNLFGAKRFIANRVQWVSVRVRPRERIRLALSHLSLHTRRRCGVEQLGCNNLHDNDVFARAHQNAQCKSIEVITHRRGARFTHRLLRLFCGPLLVFYFFKRNDVWRIARYVTLETLQMTCNNTTLRYLSKHNTRRR